MCKDVGFDDCRRLVAGYLEKTLLEVDNQEHRLGLVKSVVREGS